MNKENITVFIVTALQSEATPIIEKYKLKKQPNGPFRLFLNKDIRLIVSGMGRVNCAAGTTALLHNHSSLNQAICLNIGIAGHQSLPLGTPFIADHITDDESDKSWHTSLAFNPSCNTSTIRTISSPSVNYPNNTALDMESASFYNIATRYINSELTQVIKVVSDGPDYPIQNINKAIVNKLISDALPEIQETMHLLKIWFARNKN